MILDGNGNDVSTNYSHIANINPIRYRGYYYDVETGLYYVSSRYYDPEIGRFINADDSSLVTASGNSLKVDAVEVGCFDTSCFVYNLEVQDYHTYYVSEAELLVHNKCG